MLSETLYPDIPILIIEAISIASGPLGLLIFRLLESSVATGCRGSLKGLARKLQYVGWLLQSPPAAPTSFKPMFENILGIMGPSGIAMIVGLVYLGIHRPVVFS